MNTFDFKSELDKKFKALKKSPTLSIALKRSQGLHRLILQNTSESDIYMTPRTDVYLRPVLVALQNEVFQSVLDRLCGVKS